MTHEEEDPLPDLPSLGDRGDEEPAGPDDLGLVDAVQDEEEDVGLDDSTGIDGDDALFALDLPPKENVGPDPSESEPEETIPVDGLGGEDEYGWSDANDSSEEPWDDELDLGKEVSTSEDAGEEGVDEVFDLGKGDDDVSHLPALRGHDADDDEELPLGADAMIDEEETTLISAALLPRLAPAITKVAPGPVWCVDRDLFGGRGLFSADGTLLADRNVTSIAGFGETILAVIDGALMRGLETFEPCSPADRQLVWVAREGERRAWATTESGALFASDDAGLSWRGPLLLAKVVAVALPDDGGVVALCAGRDAPAQLVRSLDGGTRWTASHGPALGEGARFVSALGDSIAVSCADDPRGPSLSNDRGKTWARVPGLPRTGPIALAREDGGLALYAAHEGFVARHRPGGGEPALVIETSNVNAIRAERAGKSTMLMIASGDGLFRVFVEPEPA